MITLLLLLLAAPNSVGFRWKNGDKVPPPQPVEIRYAVKTCADSWTDAKWLWVTQGSFDPANCPKVFPVSIWVKPELMPVGTYKGHVHVGKTVVDVTLFVER